MKTVLASLIILCGLPVFAQTSVIRLKSHHGALQELPDSEDKFGIPAPDRNIDTIERINENCVIHYVQEIHWGGEPVWYYRDTVCNHWQYEEVKYNPEKIQKLYDNEITLIGFENDGSSTQSKSNPYFKKRKKKEQDTMAAYPINFIRFGSVHISTSTQLEKLKPIPLIAGTWLCLFFLFLPFPMDIIPEAGTNITGLFLPLTESLSATNPDTLANTHSFSDSIHLYLQTALLGILALVIVWILTRTNKAHKMLPWLRLAVTFILAFFLLKYGIEKWTRLQFPVPPPNILHAETGSLDKDILFWNLMGTSKAYAGFMGFIEILAGIFLFIKRTRFIGGYLALGVFVNVFALNIGFDITVKLLSLGLLFGSIFVISPSIRPIVQLLTSKEVTPIESEIIEIKPVIRRALKGCVVTLILLECGWPILNRSNLINNPETINHQTFAVIQTEKCPDGIPQRDYKHIHFHPHGYLITETYSGQFQSYPVRIPHGANQFKLANNKNLKVLKKGDDWLFVDGSQLLWRCKRVANEKLPLLQDDFHWTVESMIPE